MFRSCQPSRSGSAVSALEPSKLLGYSSSCCLPRCRMKSDSEDDELEEVLISTIDEESDIEAPRASRKTEAQSLLRGRPEKPALSKSKSGISKHVTLSNAESFRDKVSQAVSRISGTGERSSKPSEPFRSTSKDESRRASEKGGASGKHFQPTTPAPLPGPRY